MKKATNRILSFLTAFAMVIGVLVAPFTSANAAPQAGTPAGPTADTETTTTVTIHKIKVKSTTGFPLEQEEGATEIVGKNFENKNTKYDGGKIADDNIKDFFGDGAEELANVTFTYWTFGGTGDKETDKLAKENYEKMVASPSDYDTVAEVKALLGTDGTEKTTTDNGVATDGITVPANGHKYLWAVEKSKTITDAEGKQQTITSGAAVPFGLALPLFKADGSVNTDLHVYPKNTTANQPKVDKDFEGEANAEKDRLEVSRPEGPIVKDVKVGDEVPYDIETIIPAGTKYKTVAWTDQMTEGLTLNDVDNSGFTVTVTRGGNTQTLNRSTATNDLLEDETGDYRVTKDGNGFVLEFTKAGLAKVNEKDADSTVLIKYSATVNENAKVERPERNDVIFHYGNEPHHGNTPYPTKPNQETGELTVTKDFPDVEGDWVEGEEVEVTLIDAHTGKPAEDLPDGQTAKVTLKIDKKTHTWKDLDKDKQYKVVETFKPGDEVTYVKQDDGSVKIEDRITDNPTPLNPEEPAVVTYGHRFQKIDQTDGTGIADAEFIVQRTNGDATEYLVKKDGAKLEAEQAEYAAAEKAYKDAVKAATTDAPNTEEIAKLKEARDKAYIKAQSEWEFAAKDTNATVFKSNEDGYFKVTGLALGDYELKEIKAPKGYAKLTNTVPFKVVKGSTGETKLESGELEDLVGFKQIENKKVTIPQTGGIGSLIFIVAGLALMGVAFVAMKRRNAVEA